MFSRGAAESDEEHFVEHRGSDANSSHLQLVELGRVLKSMSTLVPGKAACTNPLTESRINWKQVLWINRGALTQVSSKLDYLIFWLQPQVHNIIIGCKSRLVQCV